MDRHSQRNVAQSGALLDESERPAGCVVVRSETLAGREQATIATRVDQCNAIEEGGSTRSKGSADEMVRSL